MIDLFSIGFVKFSLVDLFDVLVVAILFFWMYKLLKETIAVQILFGLGILIGLTFITETLGLKSFNWILNRLSEIWLIAFIILFQPELRRLLLMITQGPIFKIFGRAKISETIDELVDAAIEMSEKHIGALVVLTRSQNVEMTVDTGITLQSKVSRELLVSIFNTKSPLHDGAVIIDNQMLVAARCVLPLSHITKYEGKNLGTRHRAALGLSEQVDAIVLIVSEETGAISIAQGGNLLLNIPKEDLLHVLNSTLSNKN